MDNGQKKEVTAQTNTSVKQALDSAGIVLNALDKVNPASTTVLTEDTTVTIARVTEEFYVEQVVIPFEQQTVKNESLPEGQSVLIQAGTNGIQDNTYRILSENGVETSRSFVSSDISQPAKPEIVMIGVQSPFTPQKIDGVIAYITSANAWVMEDSTGNRKPVVSTGDLDGRIFSISPDREWLLFSRSSTKEGEINSLWLVNLTEANPELIKTNIINVVNYADWIPGRIRAFSYSTVDPVPTAPGWSANNDLLIYRFNEEGKPLETKLVVDKNSGGISGWWGTSFEWSTNGSKLAYTRPDSIGLVDLTSGSLTPLVEFDVYNTGGDWAWVPGIKWSPDDQTIYTVLVPPSVNGVPQNPALSAILLPEDQVINLVGNCGLFCYPVPSPVMTDENYFIGYLSSILPDQSETSSYDLKIMDRDASNQKKLYPGEGIQGLNPQVIKWSPDWPNDQMVAVLAQNDLILIDTSSGAVKKISGDGLFSKVDWK
jgi:resuscitation-promoting factor RpfB